MRGGFCWVDRLALENMDANENTAAAGLDASGDGGGQDQTSQRDDTFFLPADFPGADTIKEGDTITLNVVGKGPDGIEVEQVSDESEGDSSGNIGDDLGKHMAGSKSY